VEPHPQGAPHDGLIIDQQHANHQHLVCPPSPVSEDASPAEPVWYNRKQSCSFRSATHPSGGAMTNTPHLVFLLIEQV
jgi:hypothetical protein